jgi:hypothetical protein
MFYDDEREDFENRGEKSKDEFIEEFMEKVTKRSTKNQAQEPPDASAQLVNAINLVSKLPQTKFNNFYPPDWRWKTACAIVSDKITLRKLKLELFQFDTKFKKVYDFCNKLSKCKSPADLLRFKKEFNSLWEAFLIYNNDDVIRWIIEAKILTKESLESISRKTGLDLEVLRDYCDAFYDILEKLHNKEFICSSVIGRAMYEQVRLPISTVWKIIAYFGNAEYLDYFITTINAPDQLDEFLTENIKSHLKSLIWREIRSTSDWELLSKILNLLDNFFSAPTSIQSNTQVIQMYNSTSLNGYSNGHQSQLILDGLRMGLEYLGLKAKSSETNGYFSTNGIINTNGEEARAFELDHIKLPDLSNPDKNKN